jgi:hypothetical protein
MAYVGDNVEAAVGCANNEIDVGIDSWPPKERIGFLLRKKRESMCCYLYYSLC